MVKGLGFRASGRAHIPRVCAKLGAFYSRQEAIVQGADPAADEERMGEDDLMIVSFVRVTKALLGSQSLHSKRSDGPC